MFGVEESMLPIASTTMSLSAALSGDLFVYAPNRVAFEFPNAAPRKCVLLGGLSDGLFPVPYTSALADVCASSVGPLRTSLVQPILSSSYTGFGHGDLDRDVEELDELVDYMLQHRQATQIILLGHSTGCQQIVHFLKQARHRTRIAAAVLQAPVSDREAATVLADATSAQPQLQQFIEMATQYKATGKGEEMMPRAAFWAPISANRYYDLVARDGKDDYFSSDFSNEELQGRLSHVASLQGTLQRVLVACSGADEYVPRHIDTRTLTQRLCDAMNHSPAINEGQPCDIAQPLYLPSGNHNLSSNNGADAAAFLTQVEQLIRDLLPPGN